MLYLSCETIKLRNIPTLKTLSRGIIITHSMLNAKVLIMQQDVLKAIVLISYLIVLHYYYWCINT